MHLHCFLGRHAASPGEVRNQGFGFSRCLRCGSDMVRSNSSWRVVPKGFRVVWKRTPARQCAISAMQLILDLPSTGRDLVVRSDRARSSPPELLILVPLGLRYLMWAVGERLGGWLRRGFAPRQTPSCVIRLPAWLPSGLGAPAS